MMENVCEACGAIAVKAIDKGKLGGWQITTIVGYAIEWRKY